MTHRYSEQKGQPAVDIIIENCDTATDFIHEKVTPTEERALNEDRLNNNIVVDGQLCMQHACAATGYTDNPQGLSLSSIDEHFLPLESLHRLSLGTRSTEINGEDYSDTLKPNQLEKIKGLARRLNLQTRRGSYTTWRSKLANSLNMQSPVDTHSNSQTDVEPPVEPPVECTINKSDDEKLKEGPISRMIKALSNIRSELRKLREQDEWLARQFICLHKGMQQLKLERSQQSYDDMVDDAQCTIAENTQFESVCDEPRMLDRNPLLTVGITKMNLTERRFSVF